MKKGLYPDCEKFLSTTQNPLRNESQNVVSPIEYKS